MNNPTLLTKEVVVSKLQTNQLWLEAGILAIFNRQTPDERDTEATHYDNAQGFNGCDARIGSYLAKWIISQRALRKDPKYLALSGKHLEKAQKIMMKYAGQLVKVVKEKQSA
jgi:hypothetical protein